MEKIKNIINPGSKKDDEVMYGSGQSDDPIHTSTNTGSGQGSHVGADRVNDPLSSSSHPTSGTVVGTGHGHGPISSSVHPTSGAGTGYGDNTTSAGKGALSTSTNPIGRSQYDTGKTGRGNHGLNEPYASRMPGGFDNNDDAATTASVRSGIPGYAQGSGQSRLNDSSLANKPLPHEPAFAGTGSGSTGASSGVGNTGYPDRSVGTAESGNQLSGSRLGHDATIGTGVAGAGAAGAGIGGHRHEEAQRDNYAPETGRSFPLASSSSPTSRSNYPSGQTSTYSAGPAIGSQNTGLQSSGFANKADPRVDSDRDGSHSLGTTGLSSTTKANAVDSGFRTTNTGGVTGLGSATGITADSSNQRSLDSGGSATGYGPESWQHDHNKQGHQFGGDPCATGDGVVPGPHFVQGPHATDTANRLDPHVSGGIGGSESTKGISAPSQHHEHSQGHQGHHGHHGTEAALAGAAAGDFEHGRGKGTTGSAFGSSNTGVTDSSSTGPAPSTAGPHKSDMLNKLDPRVDSDLSKQQSSTAAIGTGSGSSTTGASDPYKTANHHHGKEIGLVGASGPATYETEKRHRANEAINPSSTTGSSHQHGSSGLVDSLRTPSTGKDHHLGRDAAAGTGIGGAAYEAERHYGKPTQSATTDATNADPYDTTRGFPTGVGSSNPHSSTDLDKDHHLGRDAAVGAGLGGAAHEIGHHHGKPSQSPINQSTTDTGPYDSARTDKAGTQLAGSSQQAATGHDYSKDAGVVGAAAGAGGLGYAANKSLGNDRLGNASNPQDQLAGSGHQPATVAGTAPIGRAHHGKDTAIGGTVANGAGYEAERLGHHGQTNPESQGNESRDLGYGNQSAQGTLGQGNHRKEKTLASAGAGAGAGALAGHEYSKKNEKDLEKEAKQHDKALEKEHAKEIKYHNKDVAKNEKALEKDEKKHGHEEKKHGGLLGFLHRDKPDKEMKEEEAHRRASGQLKEPTADEEMSAATGATSLENRHDPLAGEHGSQSGVHDIPVGPGHTTHEAYGTQDGHNKLHKDPPARVLESRGLN